MANFFSKFRRFDWILLVAIVILSSVGLAIQYSLTLASSEAGPSTFTRFAIFVGFGFGLFFLISFLNYRALKAYALGLYILVILLLVAVLFFGQSFRGVKGWISIGSFSFQLVELAKLILVITLASFWVKYRPRPISFFRIASSAALVAMPLILVALQPDLGSCLILAGLWMCIFGLVVRDLRHVIWVVLIIGLVIAGSWFLVLKDYQKERVLTMLSPHRDPLGAGWQITQSIVAAGSGKFFGRGLGLGPQSQLRFLPATKTDFVFAALAEELGYLGSLLVLGAFMVLFYRMAKIARETDDDFGLFLALGILVLFFIQVAVNIGMNLGIFPITGVPLPLISYGGSSLVITFVFLGILESIYIHRRSI